MQNYEAKKASYFATPPTQLINALHTTLTQILSRPLSERFAAHREASRRIKSTVTSYGLKQLATKPENQANGMTAIYLPGRYIWNQILLGSNAMVWQSRDVSALLLCLLSWDCYPNRANFSSQKIILLFQFISFLRVLTRKEQILAVKRSLCSLNLSRFLGDLPK